MITEIYHQLFLNGKKIGGISESQPSTEKPALHPPTLMIGCHKTSSDEEYWGFSDNEYDELALWTKAIPDNETEYFTGGYGNYNL